MAARAIRTARASHRGRSLTARAHLLCLGILAATIFFLHPASFATTPQLWLTGQWRQAGTLGAVGTHLCLLRDPRGNADSSEVIFWGGSGTGLTVRLWTHGLADTVGVPPSAEIVTLGNPPGGTDIFCSGHAMLPSDQGELLLVGGEFGGGVGIRRCFLFDPSLPKGADSAFVATGGGDEAIHCVLDVMVARAPYTVLERAMHIHPTVAELVPTVLGELREA